VQKEEESRSKKKKNKEEEGKRREEEEEDQEAQKAYEGHFETREKRPKHVQDFLLPSNLPVEQKRAIVLRNVLLHNFNNIASTYPFQYNPLLSPQQQYHLPMLQLYQLQQQQNLVILQFH
jgi:hypothetical protein